MFTLNEAQRRAVTEADGPSLVLAGAGSGKTLVIVERLAWLIGERGVDPRHILALTFTNRAAREMRDRVGRRLERDRIGAWLGTFHSFGLYLLRREIDRLRRARSFTVFDEADQLALMKRLVGELGAKYLRVPPRDALWWISRYKQDLAKPDRAEEAGSPEEETYRVLWTKYHDALGRVSAVDFDDLLVLPARILSEHGDVRERYQRRYQYVHVDEYQDTNVAQYRIARAISEEHGNLFVVGDEDQSIYSWRGATIRNILDFERDFPKARVFRLEQNYRSTAPILRAANAVVAHNEQRLGKTLWTDRTEGEPVRFYEAEDGGDEARFVAESIVEEGQRSGERIDLGGIAVLYRTNAQARLVEEALRRHGIPYVVVGGVRFYARKEIKDLLAYLRLLVNPEDDVSLRRVVNVPSRGLGSVTLARVEEYGRERDCPLLSVLRDIEQDHTFGGRTRESAARFVHLIDDLALLAGGETGIAHVVRDLLDRTGYRDHVKRQGDGDAKTRLEIVDEFVSACAQADERGGGGLSAFLQELALLTDVDEWDATAPAATLMTCHSAKGLEFDWVFLIGLEEGLLPHATALESGDELEEERRLCYVAMTRARRRLTLTSARERVIYGERRPRGPSRFLGEMPRDELEAAVPGGEGVGASRRAMPGARRVDPAGLKVGVRVRHAKFGQGVVMYTKGTGKKLKARIRFQSGRSRDFMVSAAPLEVLEGE